LNQPDFSILDSVSQSIGLNIRKGTLVILETTVPIGTTRNRLSRIIEKNSSFEAGRDFLVAFSPERVLTGRIFDDLKKYPKLVGGISEDSALRAKEFYEEVLDFDERPDLDAEAAEFSKLAETTYRDVNIALANQFAKHASQWNLDVTDVIEASNSQPFSHIHSPGIWVGGHCIPVYPYLYLFTDVDARIVKESRKCNEGMALYAVKKVQNKIGSLDLLNVLILGVSYRSGVKEVANSGVFALKEELEKLGCDVSVFDNLYSENEIRNLGLRPYSGELQPDVIVIHTEQPIFYEKMFRVLKNADIIVDGRNSFKGDIREQLRIIKI
jgi:UDP-N-acetyl-D-glucosamine dehydrogenase